MPTAITTPIQTVFEFPGNIIGYKWPEDGSKVAASIVATGAGNGTSQLIGFYLLTSTGSVGSSIPALCACEEGISFNQVNDTPGLNQLGYAEAALRAAALVTPQITVRADQPPVLGSYKVGDHVRVRITDARFPVTLYPQGFDQVWRITAIDVKPPAMGGQDEKVIIDLAQFSDSIPPS